MQYRAFNFENLRADPRYARFSTTFNGRPSWVLKLAVTAAMLVIVVPIVVLVAAAIGTFLLVFLALSLVHAVVQGVQSLFTPRSSTEHPDGRRNVRVIETDRT